jgi:SAM-dependent methyltransferase
VGPMTAAGDELGPVPSDSLIQMYSGSARADQYVAIGDSLLALLIQHAGLQPHHKVLDVGCGIGLAARPLVKFLDPAAAGSYDGFDVVPEPIEWCQARYRTLPHFRFQHADVYNKHYNPKGRCAARQYAFPYPSGAFDVVVLTSVFTHLLPDDLKNYLAEVTRVMKQGARCVITYFLLNPESSGRIDSWLRDHPDETDRGVLGGLGFRWEYSSCCRLYDREVPETAVAYDENWVRYLYKEHSLEIEKVWYGEWCRASLQPGWQDLVLAIKR